MSRVLKYCDICGRKNLRCKEINGKGVKCKNVPKLCGFCHMHCRRGGR